MALPKGVVIKFEARGGKHHFFQFSFICDRAAADKKVEKTDQNSTLRSSNIARQSSRFTYISSKTGPLNKQL